MLILAVLLLYLWLGLSAFEKRNILGIPVGGMHTLIGLLLFQYPQTDRNNEDVPNRPAPALDTSSFYHSKPKRSNGYALGISLALLLKIPLVGMAVYLWLFAIPQFFFQLLIALFSGQIFSTFAITDNLYLALAGICYLCFAIVYGFCAYHITSRTNNRWHGITGALLAAALTVLVMMTSYVIGDLIEISDGRISTIFARYMVSYKLLALNLLSMLLPQVGVAFIGGLIGARLGKR